jgi:hypothetical protein
LLLIPLAGVLLVAGIDRWRAATPGPAAAAVADWRSAGYGPRNLTAALKLSDDQLALNRERVRNDPGEWLRQEGLARASMARARLEDPYTDLVAATRAIDRAMADAPPGSGPLSTAAALGMMTHRLPRTAQALDAIDRLAVPPEPAELGEALALRGDVAFYRGDMTAAGALYGRAERIAPGPGVLVRRAIVRKARGDFDGAIRALYESQAGTKPPTPFAHASLALQIGGVEMARGNHAAAARWFAAADRTFAGYWYFEAHRAQSMAVAGDLPGAIRAMRAVAAKTDAAEAFDALAMLLRADGQAAESRAWAAKAAAAWTKRIELLPEAAYGHALEHELVFGTPDRALVLAQANLKARPFGESRILLASAQLMNGQTGPALRQLALAERSGWRSAPLYALRTQALELSGRPAEAQTARDAAEALNPKIFAPETALVWFSHG